MTFKKKLILSSQQSVIFLGKARKPQAMHGFGALPTTHPDVLQISNIWTSE